jgi:hypothetical protein
VLSRVYCTAALGRVQRRLVLASLDMSLMKSLLKLVVVLGVLAAVGVATGVINVKFKPLG